MDRELRRRRSAPGEQDDHREEPRPAPRPADRLLALQRSAGNQSVARLLVSDNVLHAPASWLDKRAGDKTLRELWKARDSKLVSQLQASLPRPALKGLREIDGKALEREVLTEASWDDEEARGKYVEWAVGQLQAHNTLVELSDIENLERPAARPIMNANDLVPEPDDLAGKKVGALTKLWCVLIAIVKSEGMPAVRQVLEDAKAPTIPKPTDKEPAYHKAMHDYYYGVQHILYDDTAAKPGLLSSYGYKLAFAGPVTWPQLWKAKLKAGDRLIVDVTGAEGHTMYVQVKQDFDQAEHATKPLGSVFTLHNESANWNFQDQYTFGMQVLYVYKRG